MSQGIQDSYYFHLLDWSPLDHQINMLLTLTQEIKNYKFQELKDEEINRLMDELNLSRVEAQNRVQNNLKRNQRKITLYGYDKFYIDAKLRSDEEVKESKLLDPEFNWKNADTPRTHKHWFQGKE